MSTIKIRLESISGILHDCFKTQQLTSSILQRTEGRITIFEFEIDENIPVIEFIKAIAKCKYHIYKCSHACKSVTLRETM